MLLLNKWSYKPQLELILKSCVCSLKWAQIEVCSSIRLVYISSQSFKGFSNLLENDIDLGWLLLLNKLSRRPQLGLILKSWVCSLKWAQVELNCSNRLEDISFRSYLLRVEMADYGLYHQPTKKWKFWKKRSGKYFAKSCHGSHAYLTTRNHNKSSSTPSLKQAVLRIPCGQVNEI